MNAAVKSEISAVDGQQARDEVLIGLQNLLNSLGQMKKFNAQKQPTFSGVDAASHGAKVVSATKEAQNAEQKINDVIALVHKANEQALKGIYKQNLQNNRV